MRKFFYLWISILVIILDQISKIIARNSIELHQTIKVTEKFFWLTRVQNTGAGFSLSFGNLLVNRLIFIIIPIIAVFIIIYLIKHSKSLIEIISFSLILGGATGNLIDRIIFGSVTDFIWWDFPDFIMERWPVFNIADSSIVAAICLLIINSIFFSRKTVEEK
ncbi:MAG: signal peptidase II [Candidatus Cloacimonetes bacterium]|nr:signal peptidase II [Candidatus Cloacimonadota bacterium]